MLAREVRRVVALDFSEAMIRRARSRLVAEGVRNITCMVSDVRRLGLRGESFNKVICTSVLQYLDDSAAAAAVEELVRSCKKGGTIVLHLKNQTSIYGASRRLAQALARRLGRTTTPDHYRSRAWYERAITTAGGQLVEIDSYGILTFVPAPAFVTRLLLLVELHLPRLKHLKRFGVNCRMTIRRA
jgi:ubiquinone/menaquinone biosynthesis C-methylase UbiE